MAIICWGNLAKSADSTQRIEESIQGYIETHDENPNAHMGEDYALGVHRLDAVLDHMHGSVQLVHLAMDSMMGMSVFESLDAWTTVGVVQPGIFGAMISTSLGGGIDTAYMVTGPKTGSPYIDFGKNPFFQTTVTLGYGSDYTAYITAGDMKVDIDGIVGFGFKIVNGTLYTIYNDGGADHTHSLGAISPGRYCFRAYINSIEQKIYFYLDGILVHTTAVIDTDNGTISYFLYWIHTDGVSNRGLYPLDWLFQQDR